MADSKITALTALTSADPANDMIPIVDVSDTPPASGNTKRISINNILAASGTATLASATITGDLTVDTSTLKVDSTNNRVGIGTASPGAGYVLDVVGAARITAANGLVIDKAGAGFVDFLNSGNSGANVGTSGTGGLTIYTANGIGGSYGVRYVIDSTGISTWSVAGTTAMTLDSTGLGIGGSPTAGRLHVKGGASQSPLALDTLGYNQIVLQVNGANRGQIYADATNCFAVVNSAGSATPLVVTDTGNVGIGVTPSAWISGSPSVQLKYNSSIWAFTDNSIQVNQNAFYDGAWKYINAASLEATNYFQNAGKHIWRSAVAGTAGNAIDWTTPMTLDASGNLLLGATVATAQGRQEITFDGATAQGLNVVDSSAAATSTAIGFVKSAGTRGNILVTATGTTYNTVSDYRLKESVKPISGGLARVNALKPSIYNWKSAGSTGEGFLAHELAEVVPFAVSGEKDAVNADGSINAQSVDMSRIVPILVAAIQELTARVQTLEAR